MKRKSLTAVIISLVIAFTVCVSVIAVNAESGRSAKSAEISEIEKKALKN